MIPKIIHHIYVGGKPPEEMLEFMATAKKVNPNWSVVMWDSNSLALLGLNYQSLLSRFGAPVHVSDYVRLAAVNAFGGIYLDSDVECIRSMDTLCEHRAVAAFQDGTEQICPAIFGAEAGHPWIKWQMENADLYSQPNEPWNVGLMTDAPRDGLSLVPTDTFYPWLWTTPKKDRSITERTLCVHHWKGSWAPWVKRDRS